MVSPKEQAEKLLQNKKGMQRWLILFLVLALLITTAVVMLLHLNGEAMNHKRRVMTCAFAAHTHTGACYEGDRLVCGMANYTPHVHTAACYDPESGGLICGVQTHVPHAHTEACYENGELVCGVVEYAPHAHTAACYAEDGSLICGMADYSAHTHNDDCYDPQTRALICPLPEIEPHVHDESCYGEIRALVCGQEEVLPHTHTAECYAETRTLTCGQEEAAPHTHDESCYTVQRTLGCGQEETPPHTHDESCYTTEQTLSCGLEESEEHTHSAECYTTTQTLTCTQPETEGHVHTEACYTETPTLGCGLEETAGHTHDDSCYTVENELVCGLEENPEGGHVHDDSCYAVEQGLVCGKQALHTHTDACKDPETGAYICGQLQLEEHRHTAACFREVDMTPEEIEALEEEQQAKDQQLVYEDAMLRLTADFDTNAGLPETARLDIVGVDGEPPVESSETEQLVRPRFTDGETELTPAATVVYTVQYRNELGGDLGEPLSLSYTPGGELPAFARAVYSSVRTLKTDEFELTAVYTTLADIPEEAELRASLVTDEQTVAEMQAAYRSTVHSEDAEMERLLDIGFWIGETEIQPAAPVEITVQFLDEAGLPAGETVTVVHFAQDGAEVLHSDVDEQGAASFALRGFSMVAIGRMPGEDALGRVSVDHAFEWQDPNGLYRVVFQLKGILAPRTEDAQEPAQPEQPAEEGAPEETPAEETPAEDAPLANTDLLAFSVSTLAEGDAEYGEFAQFSDQQDRELLDLAVLCYTLTYDGVEMDLSGCEITATVTPTPALEQAAQGYTAGDAQGNGDDDGDGYVVAPDGESMLPAPAPARGVLVSAILPTGDEEKPLEVTSSMTVGDSSETLPGDGGAAMADLLSVGETAESPQAPQPAADLPVQEAQAAAAQDTAMTFSLTAAQADDGVMAFTATSQPNPKFTVECVAYLRRVETEPDNPTIDKNLPRLINTDNGGTNQGGNLPTNGNLNLPTTVLSLTEDGHVATAETLTKVYREKEYTYYAAPSLSYFNALLGNKGYTLSEIRVQYTDTTYNPGYDPEVENWQSFYPATQELHFTNHAEAAGATESGAIYIYLGGGARLQLVFRTAQNSANVTANFFDYDISEGVKENQRFNKKVWSTDTDSWERGSTIDARASGINAAATQYGEGESHDHPRYAFGNANTGTRYRGDVWVSTQNGITTQNRLNMANRTYTSENLNDYTNTSNSYMNCTFGLAAGITSLDDPDVVFADGIAAPLNLFSSGVAHGKRNANGNLNFTVDGDTYTLSTASVENGSTVSNLERFVHPQSYAIWTNNFWPMDGTPGADGLFGKTSNQNPFCIGDYNDADDVARNAKLISRQNGRQYAPTTDDGGWHNAYFGMRYQVKFKLDPDYIGPLEYYFFGDDDMWVFLDDTLVCDIGGIHSSVGEYVNLWDYIEKDSAPDAEPREYTLTFFYTERGASGSTCWMQFTLPSVTSASTGIVESDYGALEIHKTVEKVVNDEEPKEYDNDETFSFTIQLKKQNGENLQDDYSYTRYGKDGTPAETNLVLRDGSTFTLKHGEYIRIRYLPEGTVYTVTENNGATTSTGEISKHDYLVFTGDGQTDTATGSIEKGLTSVERFTNRYSVYALPETGGTGAGRYLAAGGVLAAVSAGCLLYMRRRRKK